MRVSLGPLGGAAPRALDAYTFSYGDRAYRGTFSLERVPGGGTVVVNTLPLDAYLYGVVSHEVSAAWPRAALQAQAIAARTYAYLRRRPALPYDVVASTSDQFYGGVAAEEVPVRDAVDSTAGRFVLWNGAAAHVLYSSCCGGRTATADEVRLPAEPVEIALDALGPADLGTPPPLAASDAAEPTGDAAGATASPEAPALASSAPTPTSPTDAPAAAEALEPTAADIDAEMHRPKGAPRPSVTRPPYVPPRLTPIASAASAPRPRAGVVVAGTPEAPYLAARHDPYCTGSPDFRWHRDLAFGDPGRYFGGAVGRGLGALRAVERREVAIDDRSRVVRLIGSKAAFDIDSADFRRRLGASIVRSTQWSRLAYDGRTLAIDGAGFGHGAGMCQWGARGMAAAGASVDEIVAFYFPGTTLGSV